MKPLCKLGRSSVDLNRFRPREGWHGFEITRHIVPRSDNTALPGPLTYSNSGRSGHHLFSGCAETPG